MISKKIIETIPRSVKTLRSLSLETLGGTLSLQQLRILKLVSEGYGATQISKTLDVSMPAVSKMIEALVGKGLIVRKEGKDKRTIELKLTAKGKKLWSHVMTSVESRLNTAIHQLSVKEKESLLNGLVILDKVFEQFKKV